MMNHIEATPAGDDQLTVLVRARLVWSCLENWYLRLAGPVLDESPTVTIRQRLVLGLILGLVCGVLGYYQMSSRDLLASDFTYPLRAARRIMLGLDPYRDADVGPNHAYPFEAQFPYPLPAALLALPLITISYPLAGAIFCGLSAATLAIATTRRGLSGLTIMLSPPFFVAMSVGQWSPLLVAIASWPALLPLACIKPTIALPILLSDSRRLLLHNRAGLIGGVALVAVSLAVMPDWPWRWFLSATNQDADRYSMPIRLYPGVLMLLALICWHQRSARLLILMALTPQHAFFYDQLPLWLIPRTWKQSLGLSFIGWVGYLAWFATDGGEPLHALTTHGPTLVWVVRCFYLPALILVLWQGLRARADERAARLLSSSL